MNIQIDMDKLNAHVGKAVEKAVLSYLVMAGRQQAAAVKAEEPIDIEAKIIAYIKQSKSFADDIRYSKITNAGYMPYGKLLRLMKMPSVELIAIVKGMLATGSIAKVDSKFGFRGLVLCVHKV